MINMAIVDKFFIKKPRLRRFITKLIYGNIDKTTKFFDTTLFINSIKENGYLRASNYAKKSSVFRDEVSALINLSSLISNNTTFVDVGANVGLFSSTIERFSRLFQNLNIYAFEANPDTFARLSKTVEGTKINVFNTAISNEEATLEFVEGAVSHVFAEKHVANSYHYKELKTIKINAKRLDQFSIVGNDIILKVDVEGHEYQVLEGAQKFFEAKSIKAVFLDSGYQQSEKVISFLKSYQFTLLDGKTLGPLKKNENSLLALLQDKI